MNKGDETAWSPDDIDLLKTMWADGASAGDIEAAMGKKRTRSAIIGKIHRLKLPTRPQDAPYQRGMHFAQKPKAGRPLSLPKAVAIIAKPTGQKHRKVAPPMAGNSRAKAMIFGDGPPAPQAEPTPIRSEVWRALPGTVPVPLTQRTGCHWPIGDDSPFLMCNAEIESGVYCATHNRTSRSAYNVRR